MMLAKIQLLKHRINQTLSKVFSGSQPLTWFGPGTLTLTGANTYTGTTTINAGTLAFSGSGKTPNTNSIIVNNTGTLRFDRNDTWGNNATATSAAITVNAGGTLASNGTFTTLWDLTLNGGAVLLNGGASATYPAFQLGGTLTATGTSTVTAGSGSNNFININGFYSGVLTVATTGSSDILTIAVPLQDAGAGALTKSGSGTLVLSATNTYTGTTTISAGTLEIGGAGQLGSGNYSGTISDSGTLKINSTANQTLGGVISGTGSMVKDNTGTLTLTGANTYTGTTTVNGGTLALAGPNINGPLVVNANGTIRWDVNDAVADTTVTVNGGTLNLTSKNDYINTLSLNNGAQVQGAQSANQFIIVNGSAGAKILGTGGGNAGTISSRIAITSVYGVATGARTQEFDVASATTLTVSGPIVDAAAGGFSGSLLKSNSGTLTLTGVNTYTGTTTVSAGTLTISNASGLGTGAGSVNGTLTYTVDTTGTRTVTVNSGGVINKGGFSHTGTAFVNNGGTINA